MLINIVITADPINIVYTLTFSNRRQLNLNGHGSNVKKKCAKQSVVLYLLAEWFYLYIHPKVNTRTGQMSMDPLQGVLQGNTGMQY